MTWSSSKTSIAVLVAHILYVLFLYFIRDSGIAGLIFIPPFFISLIVCAGGIKWGFDGQRCSSADRGLGRIGMMLNAGVLLFWVGMYIHLTVREHKRDLYYEERAKHRSEVPPAIPGDWVYFFRNQPTDTRLQAIQVFKRDPTVGPKIVKEIIADYRSRFNSLSVDDKKILAALESIEKP